MKKIQLIALWSNLSKRRHKQIWFTLVLMFLASLAEIITIGAVIPFLGILTAPEQIYNHDLIKPFNDAFNITSSEQLLFPLTLVFMLAAVLAGIIRLALLFVMTRLSWSAGADLSVNIYHRTLYQEYSIHVARNSSEIINSIITKTGAVISGVIHPILTLVSSFIIILITISIFVFRSCFMFWLLYFKHKATTQSCDNSCESPATPTNLDVIRQISQILM